MTRLGPRGTDIIGCSKRLWVMTALSDDELLGEEGSLPQGLRFHVSQCESCRVLAESLLSVSQGLGELSVVEPPDELGVQIPIGNRGAYVVPIITGGDIRKHEIRTVCCPRGIIGIIVPAKQGLIVIESYLQQVAHGRE